MATQTTTPTDSPARYRPVESIPLAAKVFAALLGGVALFLVLISLLGFGYERYYRGQIFPGVSVAGLDLSGMQPVEAAVAIARHISYPETGTIVFQDVSSEGGNRVWQVKPSELGLSLNLEETVSQAYTLGRRGNPLNRVIAQLGAWYRGRDLPPVLVYDEYAARAYLAGVAAQVDRPMLEATLSVQDVDVIYTAGQVGRQVDLEATMQPLETNLSSMTDGLLPLVINESRPVILDVDAAANQVRYILQEPLVLSVPDAEKGDPGPWEIDPQTLAKMVVIEPVTTGESGYYNVRTDVSQLRPLLEEAAPKLSRQPQNGRFIFNDETRQLELLESAVIGRSLNIDQTLASIETALALRDHQVDLTIDFERPAVTSDATADQLGIRELVSEHTSYFYGSDNQRIQNIKTAAARFHGVLVPPGATFSMAEIMGDVSLDTGYAEAWIIFGDRTIKGVGGGVCQVSTTLFRTVFLGGYPVVERYPHAYRVGYYEQTASGGINSNLAGLDATVYVPVVDFKFINDSPSWLLMETYVNAAAHKLTWKFYSTSDGRKVDWDTTGLTNVVTPPKPQYIENKNLAKGKIKQVDWEVAGADVTVTRVVSRDGEVILRDSYTTHYQPWRAVFEYGPGTKIPKDS